MKNARRNIALAALAAATLAVAPSALADVRIHVSLPVPPPPHKVLRHLPAPPLPPPPVVVHEDRGYLDGRWNYENRHRDDRWHGRHRHHDRCGHVWVEGRWVVPPYPGAVWVSGYRDRYGYWVAGYWVRAGHGYRSHGDPAYGHYR
jgi:hypothetical protein